MPVWYDITCRHEPGTGPDGILARLLNELTRHPASVSQLVPRLLREIRLALCAQAVQYFRRSDDGDYLIVEAADSRDPNDTLELAQQAHPLTPDGIPIYRAFWDDCEGVRGPALVNFTDPAVRARLIPASVPWHDRFGARWGLCCPLFADARAVGFLGVRTDDPAGFAEPVRAAVQRLADQLALAVTIERLTRQVVEAADLRARQAEAERRAAEAKRISDFLVRTAGGLAGGADLSAVLERIVVGLAETLDAAHVFLFRHDPATNLIRLHVSAIDGVYRGGPSGAEVPLWAAPFPADISPAWRLMCERRGLYTPDMCPIPAEEFAWPGVLDYAARFELSDMGHMVLFCGDVPVGSMGLAFRHGRKLTPADKPFVEAVADQAAVALRLLDVAETEQEAAVAKERQAGLVREGQLLKAVAAAAEALTRGPDLSTACAEACRALGEATGVDRMGVLRYDPATSGVFLFAEWTRNGFPRWAEVNPNPLRETEYPEVYQILLAGEVYTSPLREKTGANRELNDRLQTITDLLVPVFVSGRFWGVLSFDDCTIERHWTAGEVAVLRTAAEALAAAVRREKLEREKTEVVAQERQAAAEQRAAELAAVNATLARSLSAASGSTDFEQILDVVFREVVRAAAAPAGLLFTYDPIANTLTTQTWVDESGSGRGCCPGAPPLLAGPFDADVTPGFRQFVQAKRILGVVDLKNPPPEVQDLLWSGVTDWHLAHGRVAACTIPVMCGEQPLGVIGLAWHTNVQFSQLQSELLFALTNQVAIVLQLSDVAAARRAAVVAQERQAAAEASAEQLARRDQLLTAAARCAEVLARPGAYAENMPSALRHLLNAEGISRVTLMRNDRLADGSSAMMLEFECAVAGVPMQRDTPGAFPARFDDYAAVVDILSRGQVVNELVDYLQSTAADMQASLGVKSGVQIPLFIGETWWGTLAFDNCVERRVWLEAEVQVLRSAAAGVVSAIKRERAEEEVRAAAVRGAEERAAELMAVNKLLVGSLESFTADLDADAFITLVLERLAGVLAVPVVELWHARPGGRTVFPGPLYHAGRVWHPDDIEHPMRASGFPVPTTYELAQAAAGRRQIVCDRISLHPQIPPEMSGWYAGRFGVDKMINLPLVVGQAVIGAVIGFAPAGHAHTDAQLELGHALAAQLALAMQLGEMSERGRAAAVLEERTRLARDIHDTLAQGFLGITLHLEVARTAVASDPGRVARAIDLCLGLAQRNLEEARRSVQVLRIPGAGPFDLVPALTRVAQEADLGGLVPVRFTALGARCEVPAAVGEQIVRIVGEAVQNARKHAHAREVRVTLSATGGVVRAVVGDDGGGFSPDRHPPDGRYGLLGMRERAASGGCALTVASAPGRGTTVTVCWPAQRAEGAGDDGADD